jgi:Hint module
MRDLEIGDVVLVAPDTYSPVFMFTHKIADKRSEFFRITTVEGFSISLSRFHYLYADGILQQAETVKVETF